MAIRLDMIEGCEGFRIGWFGEGAEGDLCLGETIDEERDNDPFVLEQKAATDAAKAASPDFWKRCGSQLMWDSVGEVRKALVAARAAVKRVRDERKNGPWPEWAIRASEAGWKPPRDWLP